jgi:hypothetical protein
MQNRLWTLELIKFSQYHVASCLLPLVFLNVNIQLILPTHLNESVDETVCYIKFDKIKDLWVQNNLGNIS